MDALAAITVKRPRTIATLHPSAATAQRDGARNHRDEAYRQRDELLAVLSSDYESHLMPSSMTRLNWKWAVCVHLPAGQVAYTISDETADTLFAHLPRSADNHWDGHDRAERTLRLAEHVASHK